MNECVVLGRGFNYATAHEWSLKLKELAYVVAEPYSSADFQHGPVALARPRLPGLRGGSRRQDRPGNHHAPHRAGAESSRSSCSPSPARARRWPSPTHRVQLPERLPDWVTPIPAIIPAQLFCYHLTRAKGYNTEGPRGLSKVTLTW